MTNNELSQLFIEGDAEAPVGVKSRFRILLREWRMNHQDLITIDESPKEILTEVIQTKKPDETKHEVIQTKKPDETKHEVIQTKKPDETKHEVMYSIDKEIEIQFFNNQEFLLHFLRFVREQNPSVEIEIERTDDSSMNYVVKLIGTKDNNRIARRFLKQLLQSIEYRMFNLSAWNGRKKTR